MSLQFFCAVSKSRNIINYPINKKVSNVFSTVGVVVKQQQAHNNSLCDLCLRTNNKNFDVSKINALTLM